MKLYMVRHGESEANLDYNILKTKRDEDVELSKKGTLDALHAGWELATRLGHNRDDVHYIASTWTRAVQTWVIINGVLGGRNHATYTSRVSEHYMNLVDHPGNWELFELYKKSNWNVKSFLDIRYEDAESIRDVQERAQELIEDLRWRATQGVDRVVCVCHGQFIKQVMCLVKGLDPDTVVHPANGEIIELEIL